MEIPQPHATGISATHRRNTNDNTDIFEDIQYDQLSLVTSSLIKEYALINKDNIKGHSDIAPGRKTDPGKMFDWNRYLNNV